MRRWYLVLVVAIILVAAVGYAAPQEPTGIGVNGADGVFNTATTVTDEFAPWLAIVSEHCVWKAADGVTCMRLNSPDAMADLLTEVPVKLVLRSGDGGFPAELVYPGNLVGDIFPPAISNVTVSETGEYARWETDEFANSIVRYGTVQGEYNNVVSEDGFRTTHVLPLRDLAAGTTYYYLIQSLDRAGNMGEYYLPGYSLSGRIQDQEGVGIADVKVMASTATGPSHKTGTDESGAFNLEGLAKDTYIVKPYHRSYRFEPPEYELAVSNDTSDLDFEAAVEGQKLFLPSVMR